MVSPPPANGFSEKSASIIYDLLCATYPDAEWNSRDNRSPFQILILTILSAQTTDRQVDLVAEPLFSRYPDAQALAEGNLGEIEEIIHSTGFFHAKARHIRGAACTLREVYGGVVPDTMETLLTLPGVGRKTANIVLYHAFSKNAGIAVDTHVKRIAGRIGFSRSTDQDQVERDLMDLFPRSAWGHLTDVLIAHGRRCCLARGPFCERCSIRDYCQFLQTTLSNFPHSKIPPTP